MIALPDQSRQSWFRRKLTVLLMTMTPACRGFRVMFLALMALGCVAGIAMGVLALLPFTRQWFSNGTDPEAPSAAVFVGASLALGVSAWAVLLGYLRRREWAAPAAALWWGANCATGMMDEDPHTVLLVIMWAMVAGVFMVPRWARLLTGDEEQEWWPQRTASELREAIGQSLRECWTREVASAREEARQLGRAFLLGCLIAAPFALYAWGTGQKAHRLWRDMAADAGTRAEWSLGDYARARHLIVRIQGSGRTWHVPESSVLWRTPGQPVEPVDAQFMVCLHTWFGDLPAVFVQTGPGGKVVIADASDYALKETAAMWVWTGGLFCLGPLIEFLRSRLRAPEGGDRLA